MTMVSSFVASPALLAAFTVKVNVPVAVGVPEMIPERERVRPAGRLLPLSSVQVMGAVPVAARVWLYASPTLPPCRVVVVMTGGCSAAGAGMGDNSLA